MPKLESPCLYCPEREIGCHAQCKRYKDFRAEVDRTNDFIFGEKAREELANGFMINNMRKATRKKKGSGR